MWKCKIQKCQPQSHISMSNSFNVLSHISTDNDETPLSPQPSNVGEPLLTSSPIHSSPPGPNFLNVLQLNFNSLRSEAKKAELSTLLTQYDPDVVIGYEARQQLCNTLYLSKHIQCWTQRPKQIRLILQTPQWHRWGTQSLKWFPRVGLCPEKCAQNIIIVGGFNASGISWTEDQSESNDTCPEAIKRILTGIATRFGLSQLQNKVTRSDSGSCLDLVFTNNHTCVSGSPQLTVWVAT